MVPRNNLERKTDEKTTQNNRGTPNPKFYSSFTENMEGFRGRTWPWQPRKLRQVRSRPGACQKDPNDVNPPRIWFLDSGYQVVPQVVLS